MPKSYKKERFLTAVKNTHFFDIFSSENCKERSHYVNFLLFFEQRVRKVSDFFSLYFMLFLVG